MAEQQAQITDPAEAVASGLVRLMLSMEALYSRQSRKTGLTAQQAQLLCTAARRKAGLGEIAEVLHCDRSSRRLTLDRSQCSASAISPSPALRRAAVHSSCAC